MSIQTKFNEVRMITSDPREMLNKYLVKRVLKTWHEDFVDQDNGEVVSIERNEVIIERGMFIDQDLLAQIRFSMSTGEITEVEVSDQNRRARYVENTSLYPYTAQVVLPEKKIKFLFHATSTNAALLLLKDYVELNYKDAFYVSMIKEFDPCIIIIDPLEKAMADIPIEKWDTVNQNEIEEVDSEAKRFYQIQCRISYEDDYSTTQSFVVHSFNVDRCMILISRYIKDQQDAKENEAHKRGDDFERKDFNTMIETAKTISISCYIPREFSEAYRNQEDEL